MSERARVGILGTGWGVRTQVPAFRAAGLEVAGIWARSEAKVRRVAAEHGLPFATADLEALLARPEIALVSVTTPPATHLPFAEAALAAGKHVLCEKPTALDAAEAEAMVRASAAHPELLARIDHELRFVPGLRRFRELLASGYVGELHHAEASHLGPGRLDPEQGWDWWSDRAQGGGYLGALGSHYLDLLAWLLGRRVSAVRATLATFVRERRDAEGKLRPVTSDDFALVGLRFEGGDEAPSAPGLLHLSAAVASPPPHRVMVAGSEGTLRYEGRRLVGRKRGAGEDEDFTPGVGATFPEGLRDNDWTLGSVHLARALHRFLAEELIEPLNQAATFADGLATQRLLDAARSSADQGGGWVKV
jgi:predicted dehydrogenase